MARLAGPVVLLSALISASLYAEAESSASYAELGVAGALGSRLPDRFDRGMTHFRSSLQTNVYNVVEVDGWTEQATPSFEVFLRLYGLFGEADHNALGFAAGQYDVSGIQLREYRSDFALTQQNWRFTFPYFMFTYHYGEDIGLRPLRGWRWEAGGGFGLIFNPLWNSEGYTAGAGGFSQLGSRQRGRSGVMARVDLALRRSLGEHLALRLGPRFVYAYMGQFRSSSGGTFGARWFYLRNGGLFLASTPAAIAAPRLIFDENLGLGQALLAKQAADVSYSALELQVSLALRF
ncbi:MAG: hypothetical protein K1X75_17525 [Leptospirales bacterium]|nr:hypothetical protein [Leptospirales bacterium]